MLSMLDTSKELDEKATIRNVREFFNKELPIKRQERTKPT